MTAYRARRLPQHLGPAGWSEILGPGPAPRVLEGDQSADVLIIGAGFAGLSAARRVLQLQPQARVAVLEAGRVAEGAAGRNSGFMIDLPHELTSDDYAGAGDEAALIARNRLAISFARSAAEDYGIRSDFVDPAGKINGAASEGAHRHNMTFARHLQGLGERHEMLDAAQMAEVTGSRHYVSGLYTPGTVMLQPSGYIRGMARGLTQAGVAVFENSPVIGFERDGAGWIARTAAAGLRADKIILSVNGHLESFGVARGRLMQLFLYAAMTPELGAEACARLGGHPRWGVTPSDPMGTTMRRIDGVLGGDRIITRTCATLRPGMVATRAGLARAARVMQHKFDQRFPQLAGLKMAHVWAGHLCLSMNGVSVTREIDHGVYSACVQNGLGTARGTLTGMAAAEMACGKTTALTRHFADEDAPRRLPPQPLRQLGANSLLRWREWRARDD